MIDAARRGSVQKRISWKGDFVKNRLGRSPVSVTRPAVWRSSTTRRQRVRRRKSGGAQKKAAAGEGKRGEVGINGRGREHGVVKSNLTFRSHSLRVVPGGGSMGKGEEASL